MIFCNSNLLAPRVPNINHLYWEQRIVQRFFRLPGFPQRRFRVVCRHAQVGQKIGVTAVLPIIGLLRRHGQKLADQRQVPAYIVFGDNTLRAMARYYPSTADAMEGIPGMGEKKRAEFADAFAAEIAAYLAANSRQAFA